MHTNTTPAADYFADLFPGFDADENEANMARAAAEEAARVAGVKAAAEYRRLRPACGRCHGSGKIGAFAHVAGGVCFACGGDGFKA